MFTPDNENKSAEETEKKTPTQDTSYNPYLQSNTPKHDTDDTAHTETQEDTLSGNDKTAADGEDAKTSSWESCSQETRDDGSPKCPYCGALLRQGSKFCVSCGRSLQAAASSYRVTPDPDGSRPQTPLENAYRDPQFPQGNPSVPEALSVFDYFLMFVLTNIPIVGLIFTIYWGFSHSVGINRRNFSRALLIWCLIQYVLLFLYILLLFGLMNNGYGADLYRSSLF